LTSRLIGGVDVLCWRWWWWWWWWWRWWWCRRQLRWQNCCWTTTLTLCCYVMDIHRCLLPLYLATTTSVTLYFLPVLRHS